MAAPASLKARYDETPYLDQSSARFDTSRLLGLGRLFRTESQPHPAPFRVLDLGCASGVHLRIQAALYPDVRFTGVDFSEREVAMGRSAIAEEGHSNVELIASDFREFEVTPGAYDLIVCHGTFSWVPDDVKQRILELCHIGLAPTGLAAIAYLTYPGWKQREAIRELLVARAHGFDDPQERVRQSALLLRLLHAGYSASQSCHAQSLKKLVESMQKGSANVFLHDELGIEHDPCYFVQFAEWAAESGLTYLAEADLSSMLMDRLPESAGALLQELAPNFLETQQLIDFLVNRSGRSSLLVRDDAPIARKISPGALKDLHFGLGLRDSPPARRALIAKDQDMGRVIEHLTKLSPEASPYDDVAALGLVQPLRALIALVSRGFVDPRLPLSFDR
jgi:SAM-dependent methyltransferase